MQTALSAGDAHIHQAPFFFQATRKFGVRIVLRGVLTLGLFVKGQHAIVHTHQHDMRPLQPLGRMQSGEGDHILVLFALVEGGEQGHGLDHLDQRLLGAHEIRPRHVFDLAAAALGHPADEVLHIAPAGIGQFGAVFLLAQMRLIADL